METKQVFIAENKLKQKGLFAAQDFKSKEIVLDLTGEITKEPTKYSIEVGDREHVTNKISMYLNHSCEPNTFINREEKKLYAMRNIAKGEELSFDYNSNESQMTSPFSCACGSKNCQGVIKGHHNNLKEK